MDQRRFTVMLLHTHPLVALKELWNERSFRLRIFMSVLPTSIALVVGHYAIDRQRPYDFHLEQSYVEPPRGVEGQVMTINWRVTRHRTCPGTVERKLVDPNTGVIIAPYEPTEASTSREEGWIRNTFRVPREIPGGNIAYQSMLTYRCNWLQELLPALAIRYTTPRIIFYVEK
jgi:hypothetical protein